MSSVPSQPPSRQQIVQALAPFARPDTRQGVVLFIVDYVVFVIAISLALLSEHLAVRIVASLLAGLKMGNLYTLAHDAVHNSLTASRRLNKVLSVWGYLTGFHNYRLRQYDHLVLGHHPGLNGPQVDAYQPMSLQAYRAAPLWRRAWERFTRSPNPFAFGTYCIASRWLRRELVPTPSMPAHVRKEAWPYTLLVALYLGAWLGALAWGNGGMLDAFMADVFFAVVLPFFTFQTLTSAILYIQHTHPLIPWFADGDARHAQHGAETLAVHVQMPRVVAHNMHYILEHPAHHVLPAIPCYRLWDAQRRLNELLGSRSIVVPASLKALRDTMRRCKLYDFGERRWLDFGGRPTT